MDETVQTDRRMNRAERWLNGERSEKKLLFIQQNGCAAVTGQWCIRKERTGVMRMGEKRDAYVKLDKVSKIYGTKEVKIVAVDEISFEIASGIFWAAWIRRAAVKSG